MRWKIASSNIHWLSFIFWSDDFIHPNPNLLIYVHIKIFTELAPLTKFAKLIGYKKIYNTRSDQSTSKETFFTQMPISLQFTTTASSGTNQTHNTEEPLSISPMMDEILLKNDYLWEKLFRLHTCWITQQTSPHAACHKDMSINLNTFTSRMYLNVYILITSVLWRAGLCCGIVVYPCMRHYYAYNMSSRGFCVHTSTWWNKMVYEAVMSGYVGPSRLG